MDDKMINENDYNFLQDKIAKGEIRRVIVVEDIETYIKTQTELKKNKDKNER